MTIESLTYGFSTLAKAVKTMRNRVGAFSVEADTDLVMTPKVLAKKPEKIAAIATKLFPYRLIEIPTLEITSSKVFDWLAFGTSENARECGSKHVSYVEVLKVSWQSNN